jgi:hypothetical protein
MKIVAEPENENVESTLCDVVRMAEILKDLIVGLIDRPDWSEVPEGLGHDLECAGFAAWQMYDMARALKVEYYAEHFPGAKKLKEVAA